MANEYQKINTLFLRDESNIIIPDKFTCPEFSYLKDCLWECTEKIDGTNIHIDIDYNFFYQHPEAGDNDDWERHFTICGRTANAQIPNHLLAKLKEIFQITGEYDDIDDAHMIDRVFCDAMESAMSRHAEKLHISIYGEGYGVKIQKGGNYIKNDVGFILFDVKVNDWWLTREACEAVAEKLEIPIVPLIGYMTIPEAIEYVKKGFKSTIAENPDYDAEGLVLKTPHGLRFRNGQRIITKIKTCDFQKYRNKYGDAHVEQTPNPNYNK